MRHFRAAPFSFTREHPGPWVVGPRYGSHSEGEGEGSGPEGQYYYGQQGGRRRRSSGAPESQGSLKLRVRA